MSSLCHSRHCGAANGALVADVQLAKTVSSSHHRQDAPPELDTEVTIHKRIDTAIGRAKPLGERFEPVNQSRTGYGRSEQITKGERIQRQPREGEEQRYRDEHAHYAYF